MHLVLEYLAADNWLWVDVEDSFCELGPNWKMIKFHERFLRFTLACSAGIKHLKSIHVHIWPCVFFEHKVFTFFWYRCLSLGRALQWRLKTEICILFFLGPQQGWYGKSQLTQFASIWFVSWMPLVATAKLPWPEETVMPTQWVGMIF